MADPFTDAPKRNVAPTTKGWPNLKPVGLLDESGQSDAWTRMSLLALESRQTTEPFLTIADISVSVFNWGDVEWDGQGYNPPTDIDQFQVNQIRNDTQAINKATFREPLAFEIACSDPGTTPPMFWAGPIELGEQMGIPPEMLGRTTGPQQPLPWMLAQQIRQQLAEQHMPAEFVAEANKRIVSAIYQAYFDGAWNDPKFNGSQWASRFGLDAATQGWVWGMYEWRGEQGDSLRTISIKQALPDTQQVRIEDMQNFLTDFVFDATWAKQTFPEIAEDIEANKQEGGSTAIQIDGSTRFGQRDSKLFQRDIVVMRIGWFRDQPMPMSPEEAIDGGHIQDAASTGDPDMQAGNSASDSGQPIPETDGMADAMAAPDTGTGDSPDSIRSPLAQFQSTTTGQPVTQPSQGQPIDPNWPMKTVLRRIVAIAGKIVWDGAEVHWDIPVFLLVNEPITNTCFGVGTPFKCWQVQRANVRMLSDISEHTRYYSSPFAAMPTDVADSIQGPGKKAFVRPGEIAKISPEYFQNGRKISDLVMLLSPPPLPPALAQSTEIMTRTQTSLSNNVPVLRGDDSEIGQQSSGRKVTALQDAAVAQVNNGDEVESCFGRLAMLMNHAHVNFASARQVWDHYRKLPYSVIEAIHLTIAPTLRWSAFCTSSTGAGSMLNKKRNDAITFLQTLDPVTQKPLLDLRSTREICDLDSEEVDERINEQIAGMPPQQTEKPSESINYKDIPPTAQFQMLSQAGIQVDPAELVAKQQQDQQNEQAKAKAHANNNGNGRMSNNG